MSLPKAKTMAKSLRAALAELGVELSHSQCLNLVARQWGYADWNTLSARPESHSPGLPLPMPEGWFAASHTNTDHYEMGASPDQPGLAIIRSRAGASPSQSETGVMMQSVSALPFRGKRLELRAELRTREAGAGTIWMRIDPARGPYLAFDNMFTRRVEGVLKGTQSWCERRVVLDVDETASSIHFGFFLQGQGAVWARNVSLEPVGETIAPTGRDLPDGPINLGFG